MVIEEPHLLFSRDSQFGYPNLCEVVDAPSFLSTEDARDRHLRAFVPSKRAMDDVAYDVEPPREDEFALRLSCLRTPYLSSFPRARASLQAGT